jgi:DNA-binding transcriptional MerR regulator
LQLRLIRWAKGVGFTLAEIRELLELVGEHAQKPGDRVRSRFGAKLREVEVRMRQLASIRNELRSLAACRCRGQCPIIARAVARQSQDAKRRRSR